MTKLRYLAATGIGAALGALGIGTGMGKCYYAPRLERLEKVVLEEKAWQEELEKRWQDFSLPVGDGGLRMYLTADGKVVFANKFETNEIPPGELTQYHVVRMKNED